MVTHNPRKMCVDFNCFKENNSLEVFDKLHIQSYSSNLSKGIGAIQPCLLRGSVLVLLKCSGEFRN